MNSVVNIINGLSIKSALSDESIKALTRFWGLAMGSTTIAEQVDYPNSVKAYALALFHNVGVPVLMARYKNYLGYMLGGYSSHNERVIDFKDQQLKCNHAVIRYYTARSWNLLRHYKVTYL